MAWIGGHFAIGMACGGAAAAGWCAWRRRDWHLIPFAMAAGGVWAIIPDMPRVIREDLPGTWLAATAGARPLEEVLQYYGNVFFFHRWFDFAQTGRWGLRGLAIVVASYTVLSYFLIYQNGRLQQKVEQLRQHIYGARRPHVEQKADVQRTSQMAVYSRRREPRTSCDTPVVATVRHALGEAAAELKQPVLMNISRSGLALRTATAAEPGTIVSVQPSVGRSRKDRAVQAVVLERIEQGRVFELRCRSVGQLSPMDTLQAA